MGITRKGETESVGRRSAKKILALEATPVADLSETDDRHMTTGT